MRILFILILLPLQNWAQQNYLHNSYTLERMATQATNPSGIITTMPGAPPAVIGDVYLFKTFNLSAFELYDGKLVEGYLAKLDLSRNEFDLVTKQGVKVLKGNLVRSFIFIDSLTKAQTNFVNIKEWQGAEPLEGFFQFLVEGKMTLVRKSDVIFKKADFHPALNVGSRDHQYIQKSKVYYIRGKEYAEVPPKKNLMKIFADQQKEMNAYFNKSDINLSNEADIARLVAHYNSLF